ncbi:MAG: EVE domain-containing protein [Alphaproteobacteria bacterium]|nr:EVE domain-containing protein [Alphaproteobacteria bacterium]
MNYWLLKSEPESWSWSDQVKKGVEPWTGVRNHQAAKNLRTMRLGDLALFYHSVTERSIVGIVEIVREAYLDPTDTTGKWVCVDVKAAKPLPRPVSLAEIKAEPTLKDIALVRQSRLSVTPLEEMTWKRLLAMGGL